ncbi:hypothetical protein E4U55_007477, partial [Claviceps digitariae]
MLKHMVVAPSLVVSPDTPLGHCVELNIGHEVLSVCAVSFTPNLKVIAASMTVTMASHPQVRGHFKDEPVSDT